MRQILSVLGVLAMTLSLASAASAASPHKKHALSKHYVTRHWRGYGFLPGYPPTKADELERWEHYDRLYGSPYYGPVWPRFYRGRWNGGGFGPCWTQTPIGPMWNCGR